MNTSSNGSTIATTRNPLGLIGLDSTLNGTAGTLTLWTRDGNMSLDALRAAWVAEGLDEAMLVETETPSAALKLAVRRNVGRSQRRMLRPLDGHKGWGSVKETATDDDLDYAVGLIAKLDVAGRPVIVSDDAALVEGITAAYYANLDTISPEKAGTWFASLVYKCDALALTPRGGTYFVPPHAVKLWESMTRAIEKASAHRFSLIPAMRAEQTIASVLGAITYEATQTVEAMQTSIMKREPGTKALEGMYTRNAAELEAKLARYEGLLGTNLDGLREKLDDVRATISAALLANAADMK